MSMKAILFAPQNFTYDTNKIRTHFTTVTRD